MTRVAAVILAVAVATTSCSSPTEGGAAPASIKIVPLAKSAFPSDTAFSVSIAVLDKEGNAVEGPYVPSWRTSDTTIAAVSNNISQTGTVRTKRILTANPVPVKIYASAVNSTLRDSIVVSVNPLPVASVSVGIGTTFSIVSLSLNASGTQFVARTLSDKDETLTGRAVTWSSTNPSVISVNATGFATGVAAGISFVGATASGKSAWIMTTNGVAWSNNTATAVSYPFSYNIPGLVSNTYVDYYFDAPVGYSQVTFSVLQGSGNADLYVMPPQRSNLTPCSSANVTGSETCTFSIPATTSRQFSIRVVAKTSVSGASLQVQ